MKICTGTNKCATAIADENYGEDEAKDGDHKEDEGKVCPG